MGCNATEFDNFEKQFLELIGEFQLVTTSEGRLREALRSEATRAEAAESARDASERGLLEARSGANAATAAATQATAQLAKVQEELTTTKMQLELSERQHYLLEDKCTELSCQIATLDKEIRQLKPLQSNYSTLHRQYTDLQDRIRTATEDSKREASRLESELRRVERCASGGAEIRERARLAAAAHARERRLATAELQHTSKELFTSKSEVSRLGAVVAELQCRLAESGLSKTKTVADPNTEALAEARSALEAERAGTARLERALAAALADNATLAARLNSTDNATNPGPPTRPVSPESCTKICPIDSFLAE